MYPLLACLNVNVDQAHPERGTLESGVMGVASGTANQWCFAWEFVQVGPHSPGITACNE